MAAAVRRALAVAIPFVIALAAQAQPRPVPPPPVPPENPVTEAKRVLGKVLFWDERVSSGRTIACGTCHGAAAGGTDGRIGIHPGADTVQPSPDDVLGSPGVVHIDANGAAVDDPLFGFNVQVTPRSANTTLGAAYAPEIFWDGRAGRTFIDPESGAVGIAQGGALENQALAPILNHVEMAHEGRTWSDVRRQLGRSLPLGDATDLPADLAAALEAAPTYAALFQAAFGDPNITGARIAFAIATYERTLVPNQTPWDRFTAGDTTAMTPGQVQGWNFFRNSPCAGCHAPPLFTNQTFHNLGLRPPAEDPGRESVTGLVQDRGRFKVPTLRNVGLKPTHMHNGRIATVTDSVLWYRPNNPARFVENLDPALPIGVPPDQLVPLVDFLANALTDPRVAARSFPFDEPRLHGGNLPVLSFAAGGDILSWPALTGVQRYNIYRGELAELRRPGPDGLPVLGYGSCLSNTDPNPSDTVLDDPERPAPGHGYFYLKSVIDGSGAERGLGAASSGLPRSVLVPCGAAGGS